jgi:hypothetical protein
MLRCAVLSQAASFRLSHEKVFTPLVTLAILIQQNPQLALVRKSFPKVAQQLLNSVGSCCTSSAAGLYTCRAVHTVWCCTSQTWQHQLGHMSTQPAAALQSVVVS